MPAELQLTLADGSPIPPSLFGPVNLSKQQVEERLAIVRNVGDAAALMVVVEADVGLQVSAAGSEFAQEVRLGELGPGASATLRVRRPVSKARGRQCATLSVRGLGVT